MVLAMPKFGLTALGLVGLLPLILSLKEASPRQALISGLIFGFGYSLGLCYWIAGVMVRYGGLPGLLAGLVLLALVAILAFYHGVWAVAVARLWGAGRWLIPGGGLAWVGLEWIRSWFLTGFPWMDLGYLLTPWPLFTQTADLAGVALSGALVAATNLALALALAGPGRLKVLLVTALLWLLAGGYGLLSLDRLADWSRAAPKVAVRVVQGNIDQDRKWDQAFARETLERYFELSRTGEGKPRLIVWPETAVPFYLGEGRPQDGELGGLARELEAWLLLGAPAVGRSGGETRFYNRAWLIDDQGRPAGFVDKVHLVPYGEYVPLKKYMPFLGKVVAQVGDYSAGPRGRLLRPWFGRVGVLICYESIFPGLARDQALKGAGLLTNITNDAWFGRSSAPYQHLAMLTWRAVENRRSIARAAQTGISALIDPAGRLIGSLDLGEAGQLTGALPILSRRTIYQRIGWLFGPAGLVLAGLILALAPAGPVSRRRRDRA